MKSATHQIISAIGVLIWAGVILYFYQSDRIVKYLAPDFRWIALAGGLGLAVLGVFNLCYATRQIPESHDSAGEETGIFGILLLFVLPVFLTSLWTKDSFSEAALSRKGLYDQAQSSDVPLLAVNFPAPTLEEIEQTHLRTEDGYLQFRLMELFFATGDREMQGVLNGLKVETEGRILEEKINNEQGTRMRLYRLFMLCCIADSRVIPIVIEFGKMPPELPNNGWVKVAGKMSYLHENGQVKAVLEAERIDISEVPAEEKFLIR